MWLGFSKSLGGGFRVGVGTRLRFSSGRRSGGATQAQIAKFEKADFLRKMAEEANGLLQEFLVNNNVEPSYSTKNRLDLDRIFENSSEKDSYKLFSSAIKEIQEIVNKVSYGGSLTGARKDKLVDLIFSMREIVERSGPGLNIIADQISEKFKKISILILSSIFGVFLVLLIVSKLSTPDENFGWLSLMFSAAILSGIIYLPMYFVLKFIAKIKYKKLAVQTMKQVHGL